MKVDHFITEDGSSSLRVPELNETYHSSHGAIQESNHVFIEAGLVPLLQKRDTIKIFEVGFGTGLNAYLSLLATRNTEHSIAYSCIEQYPISSEIVASLNYPELLSNSRESFTQLHKSDWGSPLKIDTGFVLEKIHASMIDFEISTTYNLIYFDAFGPDKQPEMWTPDILRKCFDMLDENGLLVTYSAKGQLKRDLKQMGFKVETLPGPPGKFQMTRAIKASL